jgi:cyclin-dependent kinase 2
MLDVFGSNIVSMLQDLATVVPTLDSSGLDLLSKMLRLDPSKRINARAALEHEYFKDLEVA